MADSLLFAGPLVYVADYRCTGGCSSVEEAASSDEIVWVRAGVFLRHLGRQATVATPNQVVFFNRGQGYRVTHPVRCGDRCTVLGLRPRALADLRHDLDLPDADSGRALPWADAPSTPELQLAQRRLYSAARHVPDPLQVEELALRLAAKALGIALDVCRSAPRPRRIGTHLAHRRLADAARCLLASDPGADLSLADMARRLHSSPYHLCRVFRAATGQSIHGYRTRLRLHLGLERLAEDPGGLTRIALDLGFADHAHFTNAFRRAFGCTPSRAREEMGTMASDE